MSTPDPPDQPGLAHAFVLDGKGGGRRLPDWDSISRWQPSDGVLWMNLDYAVPEAAAWLDERSNVDTLMREALTDSDPRPRASIHATDDLLFVVRGINLNQGAEPEDMISIRLYVERERVITLRHRVSRSLDGGYPRSAIAGRPCGSR